MSPKNCVIIIRIYEYVMMVTYHWIIQPHDTETCVTWGNNGIAVMVIVAVCELLFTYHHFFLQPNPLTFFRGKTNYINLGSFLIKPVQRVMRYPLLLMELLGATPESHHDRPLLTEALQAIKEINVNINEYKRRKDLGNNKSRKACWLVCIWEIVSSVQSLNYFPSAAPSG